MTGGILRSLIDYRYPSNTDILGDFTEVQPEKLRVCGNPRKGIINVQTDFFASRDAESCVPEIPVSGYT